MSLSQIVQKLERMKVVGTRACNITGYIDARFRFGFRLVKVEGALSKMTGS